MKIQFYKPFFLMLLFILFNHTIEAQDKTFEWAKQIGGNDGDNAQIVATDMDGSIYTVGIFEDLVDFDPSSNVHNMFAGTNSGTSLYIHKMDVQGNFLWVKHVRVYSKIQANSITTDLQGNVCITGYFRGSGDFNPGNGVNNLSAVGFNDIFILKLDTNGDYVWAKSMGGSSADEGIDITTDTLGNVYTIGQFYNTVDFDPSAGIFNLSGSSPEIFVQKLTANGTFVWAKQIGGISGDYGSGIATDFQGNVYTTGYFYNTTDFDPDSTVFNLTATGYSTDIFIQKMNTNGDFIWAKQVMGTVNEESHGIAVDSQSNVYITGIFKGTTDFDPDSTVFNLTAALNTNDIFIQKLNTNGDLIWVKQIECTQGSSVISFTLDNAGNPHLLGMFSGSIDLDPSASGAYNMISLSNSDFFFQKIDSTGNFAWGKRPVGGTNKKAAFLAIDKHDVAYIVGEFSGTVDFNPNSQIYNMTSMGSWDAFILKFRPFQENDLGITQMALSCDTNVVFVVDNLGINTVDSFEIGWSIDHVVQPPIMVYDDIMIFDSLISITTYNWFDNTQTYQIDAWINMVNGQADSFIFNDSFSTTFTPPISIEILDTVIYDMGNLMLGAIFITPSGNPSNYQYLWNTGDTTQNVINLEMPGFYYLTITDLANCQDTFSFEVGFVSTHFVFNNEQINVQLYPNPIGQNQLITIEFDDVLDNDISYQLINIEGKVISNGIIQKKELQQKIKAPQHSGVYYLRLISNNQILKTIPFSVK